MTLFGTKIRVIRIFLCLEVYQVISVLIENRDTSAHMVNALVRAIHPILLN